MMFAFAILEITEPILEEFTLESSMARIEAMEADFVLLNEVDLGFIVHCPEFLTSPKGMIVMTEWTIFRFCSLLFRRIFLGLASI